MPLLPALLLLLILVGTTVSDVSPPAMHRPSAIIREQPERLVGSFDPHMRGAWRCSNGGRLNRLFPHVHSCRGLAR